MLAARITWTTLARLLLVTVLVAFGCSKASSGGYAAAPEGAGYGYGEGSYGSGDGGGGYDEYGGESYDFEDDSIEGEVYSPEGANLSSRGRSRSASMIEQRREFRADKAEEAPAPPPSPQPNTSSATTPVVDAGSVEPPPEQPKSVAQQRQIIYTATMQVSVHDVAKSIELAEALPERLGGWLHQRVDTQLVLRIPAERLQEAMDLIAELGVVDYRLLEALDVTAEYTDLESRIRVMTEMQAQLTKLLAQAKNVEQALEIRRALDQITMELELARGRMRELAKSIAFSTLILRFVARGPIHDLPSSNDPFPWVIELGVEATEYR